MKKPTAKYPHSANEPRQVGHLEATLTDITTTTAVSIKRWRNPLIAAAVIICAIVVIYWVTSAVRESKALAVHQEIFLLFDGPAAQDENYLPDKEKVNQFLSEVRGTVTEKSALKRAVEFYLTRAAKLEEKRIEERAKVDEKTGEPAAALKKDAWAEKPEAERALYARALEIAGAAAERLTDDTDIQVWASGVKEKVAGELKTGWVPEPRRFAPLPPRAQLPEATPANPESKPAAAASPGEIKPAAAPEGGTSASPPAAAPGDAPPPAAAESAGSK